MLQDGVTCLAIVTVSPALSLGQCSEGDLCLSCFKNYVNYTNKVVGQSNGRTVFSVAAGPSSSSYRSDPGRLN